MKELRKPISGRPGDAEKRASGKAEKRGRSHPAAVAGAALLLLVAGSPVRAQMMLPGAVKGQSSKGPPKEAGATPVPHAAKPTLIKPPGEDTIVGLALKHDGKQGIMTFERSGSDFALTKLTLTGVKISKPIEACTVEVTLATPVVARPLGRPVGADRFDVPVQLCPFAIDVLDGAVLVSPAESKCEIASADCRVMPVGLWGPSANEISPQRVRQMERDRVRLETTMRTNFRALLSRAGKDRAAVKAIAKDQAGFSSDREVTCRDYDQESAIGFCSTQITEARALALIAQFGADSDASPPREHKPRAKPKPKPVAARTPPSAAAAPRAGPCGGCPVGDHF